MFSENDTAADKATFIANNGQGLLYALACTCQSSIFQQRKMSIFFTKTDDSNSNRTSQRVHKFQF